jgi:hypothetical protein
MSLTSEQNSSFRRLVAANILTKMAMYFLAFGLLMLCTGGIRSFFMPTNASSKVLIIIGVVTALLGVLYTVIAIFVMKSIRAEITPSTVWSMGRSHRPSRRDLREIQSVSRNIPHSSGASAGNHFSYSNPALVAAEADDLKYWEPPPSYEVATKDAAAGNSTLVTPRDTSNSTNVSSRLDRNSDVV